jgi:IS5 family transposase
MALGSAQVQQRFENPRELLGDRLKEGSLYRLLADHGQHIFDDDYFSDLYTESKKGRPTIPARVMATVMVLQAFEGLSDREATDRLEVDLRWQAAAGVDAGYVAFHPTALVGQRNRLRDSDRPRRLFEDTKVVATETGAMKGRARVLDSTPIYDAVATQDTVTQLRASIRKLLSVLDQAASPLAATVRAALSRDDEYATVGKPSCDWDDKGAREVLVDELVRDALAALSVIDGQTLPITATSAADLLALVAGQDVELSADGIFRIVRKVARDRVISTVDPEARHGHKSRKRHFDGYKAHLSVDPDSELIDEVTATPANTHDAAAAVDLLASHDNESDKPEVFGDSAYADANTRDELGAKGFTVTAKCPPVKNATGRYSKDRFSVDLEAKTVTCPAGVVVAITATRNGGGRAPFKAHCSTCPRRADCTAARSGRTITIHPKEAILARARAEQREPGWAERYRADRPKVERKIAHFVRRPWGGRHARTRGLKRVSTDLDTRAGAINWARLAALGLGRDENGWALAMG